MENPSFEWMISGFPPIFGNTHMEVFQQIIPQK